MESYTIYYRDEFDPSLEFACNVEAIDEQQAFEIFDADRTQDWEITDILPSIDC